MRFSILLLAAALAGCDRDASSPRYAGRVVAHVGGYGSGTGVSSELLPSGSFTSGFTPGDPAKPRSEVEVRWSFVRRDGASDVYRFVRDAKAEEVSFDGNRPAVLPEVGEQTMSVEPAR